MTTVASLGGSLMHKYPGKLKAKVKKRKKSMGY